MKIILICLVIFLLASPVSAGLERSTSLEAEGRISVHSVIENEDTKSGVSIKGDGQVEYHSDTLTTIETLEHNLVVETTTQDKLRPLRTIYALQIDIDSLDFVYALLTQPSYNESARMNMAAMVDTVPFGDLDVAAEVFVTEGMFRNYVKLWHPESEIRLEEAMRIIGRTWYLDYITFSVPVEDEEE